jgi:hypothetical protein
MAAMNLAACPQQKYKRKKLRAFHECLKPRKTKLTTHIYTHSVRTSKRTMCSHKKARKNSVSENYRSLLRKTHGQCDGEQTEIFTVKHAVDIATTMS